MKKLIVTIAASVMSFGLFAAAADNFYSTSFEKYDDGCLDSHGKTFDLTGGGVKGWSTTVTEPFELGAQDASALPYDGSKTRARRNSLFKCTDNNDKYLKLDTGADTLAREIGKGQIFIDQLVKFSVHATDPVIDGGAKIAVWMKESDSGYLLCATVGTGVEARTVRIRGDYSDPTKWYRLTIKSLGNVRKTGSQAGFLVYINGFRTSIVEDDREYLVDERELSDAAGGYYAEGCLFAAVDTTSAEISSIAYSGYGSIDDLIISEEAPKFAEDPYTFTITPPDGLEVVSVEANGGELDEPYTVPPGTTVRITYVAAEGYKITSDTTYDDVEINDDGQVIDDTTDVKFAEVVAQLFREGIFFDEYVKDELYDVIMNLQNEDQILFTGTADIYDGDLMKYGFTENTKLTVEDNDGAITWKVDVFNDGWGYEGTFSACDEIEETKTINAWFESEDGILSIQADVAGSVQADVGLIAVENDITVSGVVTAANIVNAETITLSGAGKLVTQNDELNDVYADDGSELEILENIPEEGWFTYQIGAPAPVDTFTVTVNLGEDITAVATNMTQGGEAKVFLETGSFTVNTGDVIAVVYACSASGYKPTVAGVEETIEEDTELAQVNKELLYYAITYNDIDGWVEGFEPVESYTVESETFDLPGAGDIEGRAGAEFQNWTNELGEVVTEVMQGSTGDLVLYAAWKTAGTDPVIEIIGDKVEGFNDLPSEEQKAAYAKVQYLSNQFEDVDQTKEWIASVYGDGAKIPVSKFVATTEELIDISVKYDLPILTAGVEVETAQAADGAFTFKLVDEGEDVSVAAAKVAQMIEWSADLVNFEVNTDEVSVTVDDDNVTLKATFAKPDGETKGFMKLRLFADE